MEKIHVIGFKLPFIVAVIVEIGAAVQKCKSASLMSRSFNTKCSELLKSRVYMSMTRSLPRKKKLNCNEI